MTGVPLALRTASQASLDARLHDGPRHIRIELRLSAQKAPCGGADISAIQTQPDTVDQHLEIRFTEGSIRASGTAQSAIRARLDA